MEEKSSIAQWRLTLAESIALAVAAGTLTLWLTTKFQTKDEASKLEQRVQAIEVDISSLRSNMNSIAVDVSYIRGRLEPKVK